SAPLFGSNSSRAGQSRHWNCSLYRDPNGRRASRAKPFLSLKSVPLPHFLVGLAAAGRDGRVDKEWSMKRCSLLVVTVLTLCLTTAVLTRANASKHDNR